jgi:hypothetical protein
MAAARGTAEGLRRRSGEEARRGRWWRRWEGMALRQIMVRSGRAEQVKMDGRTVTLAVTLFGKMGFL